MQIFETDITSKVIDTRKRHKGFTVSNTGELQLSVGDYSHSLYPIPFFPLSNIMDLRHHFYTIDASRQNALPGTLPLQ